MKSTDTVTYKLGQQFKRHLPRRWLYMGALALLLLAIPARMAYVHAQPGNTATDNVISVQALWPTSGVSIHGKTAFISQIPNQSGDTYDMFWYVDSGTWNWMGGAPNDQNVKQATVDVSGWNWNPNQNYTIHFVGVLHGNGERIFTSVPITVDHPVTAAAVPTTISEPLATPPPPVISTPKAATNITATAAAQLPLFINPDNPAVTAANQTNDSTSKRILSRIAAQPTSTWFGGWNTNITGDVGNVVSTAAAHNQLPTLVAYNIPGRDCGGFSSGGASDNNSYINWVHGMANGIGNRPAIVILEPDALADMDCLSGSDQTARYNMIASAVTILKANTGTRVYIDAGHPGWKSVSDMSGRLKGANVAAADGFSLNISNFMTTSDNASYGNQISGQIGGKHYVIDTSRNGNGSSGANNWCNPDGRAFGPSPSTNTGSNLIDDYLWIKMPGESDGQCNGGPAAGTWWTDYAVGLGRNSNW